MKNNLPKFAHSSNARLQPEVQSLIKKYGYGGYGKYWILYEKIAGSSNVILDLTSKTAKLDLAHDMGYTGNKLELYIKFLYGIGLVNIKNGKIAIRKLSSEYQKYLFKKKMQSQRKNYGEYNANWRGEKTSENILIRSSRQYKDWIKKVFERDSYTCQYCGTKGGKLNAHHIKPFSKFVELRIKIDNGLTLCKCCHTKAHEKVRIA